MPLPNDPTVPPVRPAVLTAPPRRSRTGIVVVIVLVVALAAAAYWWFNRAPAAGDASAPPGAATKSAAAGGGGRGPFDPNAKPAPVATASARKADFPVYLTALGTVTPIATVTVHPRVDGPLMKINFKEGELVKAGQVLAEIDPRTFAVQVAQADGTLQKDRALLANAKADLVRYETLLAQDSIARQQVDTQASLVHQYEATIAGDQGNVDSAKLQLSFTQIVAPISGRLGLRQVDVGNIVHAADANGIVVITQVQPIDVVYTIPESNVQQVLAPLRDGQVLPVDAWNRDQTARLASGKVLTIDNQIDVTTGTVKMKAEFTNADMAMFPNQFVNVRMLVSTLNDATVVPSAAVQRGTQGTFVYRVDASNVVSVRVVKMGPVAGETSVITDGLVPGDVVVIDGTDRLREGQKVETVSRDTTVAPTGARRAGSGKGAGGAGAGGTGATGTGATGAGATGERRGRDGAGDKSGDGDKANAGGRVRTGDKAGAAPADGAPPPGPPPG